MTAFDAWLKNDAAAPTTYAKGAPLSLGAWVGRWRIVKQGQSAHVTLGDCERKGRTLRIAANRLVYEDDGCNDRDGQLRLTTDCHIAQATVGQDWDFSRYVGDLQDLVGQEIVNVVSTGCSGPFATLMVLRSGDLLTEWAGNYYVLRREGGDASAHDSSAR
jgi:hypothetical protein